MPPRRVVPKKGWSGGVTPRDEVLVERKPRRADLTEYSADQLLDKADEFMATFNYDLALRFCDRALGVDEDCARAMETKAAVLLELGQLEAAIGLLRSAIEEQPSSGHEKYMLLAQCVRGEESVELYTAGLQLVLEDIAAHEVASESEEIAANLAELHLNAAATFCSIAELYLTDLCMEDGAQEACVDCLERALDHDPKCAAAMLNMASVSMSIHQPENARAWLDQSLALWRLSSGNRDDGGGAAVAATDKMDSEEDLIEKPPYEIRISTAKLLLELGDNLRAIELLEDLLEDDDEVVEVWYLVALAHHFISDDSAAELLVRTRRVYGKLNCEQAEILTHVEKLLASYPADVVSAAVASDKVVASQTAALPGVTYGSLATDGAAGASMEK